MSFEEQFPSLIREGTMWTIEELHRHSIFSFPNIIFIDIKKVERNCLDKQKVREVIIKNLTCDCANHDGQLCYHKKNMLKELGI